MIGGELKLAAGDTASAIRLHLRAAEIKPDLPHNWYGLGMAYRAAGLHDEALDALQRAADSDTRALYDLDLGHQLFHARNFNAASRAFRRTHEKAPRLIDGDIGETRSLLLAGSYEEALRTAESLIMKLDTTSSKQNRRAPHVSLASDSEDFEMVRGLDLETLRDYVIRLHRWAQDLSTGIPIDPSLAGLPVQSPLLPVLRLDVSLLL
jgi:tetratricopeptide (TPR) repeat protein